MPSPLQGSWLWPANRGARAASGPRDQAAVPRDHTFDKLFDAEEQRRRRARSQSSRRSEKVFPAPRRAEAVRAEHRSQPVQGPSLREAAAAAREAALRVEPPERRPLPGRAEELGPGERLVLGLDCDEVLPGLLLANGRTVKAVAYMRELRVTHVINTASRDVWLPSEKLSNIGIDLFQFHVDDVPSANIAPFFRCVCCAHVGSVWCGGDKHILCGKTSLWYGFRGIDLWLLLEVWVEKTLGIGGRVKPTKGGAGVVWYGHDSPAPQAGGGHGEEGGGDGRPPGGQLPGGAQQVGALHLTLHAMECTLWCTVVSPFPSRRMTPQCNGRVNFNLLA